MRLLYKKLSHPHFSMVAAVNADMDKAVKSSEPAWISRALSTAVRTECYETAVGLAEYALATFGSFSRDDRVRILPWIVDALMATGDVRRARHLLLSNLTLIENSDLLFGRFSTMCLNDDEVDPQFAVLPSGKLNAYYLGQARFARNPKLLGIIAKASHQLSENPQNNLLVYNHFAATEQWGEARLFLNKVLTAYSVPVVSKVGASNNVFDTIAFASSSRRSSDDEPLVSVIVSCFGAEETIEYSLRSMIRQTYAKLEILVCDDRSSDGTRAKISAIAAQDPRIRVFSSRRNQGPYNIRNNLIREATGEIITFHDADDISVPTRIAEQVRELTSRPERAAVLCRCIRFTPNGHAVFFKDNFAFRTCAVSLMFRRAAYDACGPYRGSRFGADTEFYERLRVYYGDASVHLMNAPLLAVLWSDASLTRTNGIECTEDGYRGPARRVYAEAAFRERLACRSADAQTERRLREASVLLENAGVVESKRG